MACRVITITRGSKMAPRTRNRSGTPSRMRWDLASLTVAYMFMLSLKICLMQTDEYPSTCAATTVPKVPWPICSNMSMCLLTIGAATSSWDYARPSGPLSYFASLRQAPAYCFLAEFNFQRFQGRLIKFSHPDFSSARSK